MRSAFERVQFDDRSDGAGTSGNDLLGNRDRTHNSCLGAIRSAGDIPASARAKECGEMWFDRYVIVGKLGEGAFSEVFLAADTFIRRMGKKHDRTRLVTIKRMNTRDGLIGMSDYHIISQLNSLDPRSKVPITESMDEFNSPGSSMATMREVPGEHVCLVMEPLLGASLHEAFPQKIREIYTINDEVVAKRVHMGLIQTIGRQMLVAVAHLHNNSLIHADIKSSNVICADDSSLQVKLIDFGNAVGDRDVAEYYSTFEIQTVWFRAPEVAYQQPFGKAIDLWSIACILCELWLGRSLFTDSNNRGLIRSMWKLRGPPPARIYSASPVYRSLVELWSVGPAVGFATPISPGQQHGQSAGGSKSSLSWDSQVRRQWLKYSLRVDDDDFVSLVDSLLEYDPEARLTASEALEHPFFLGTFPS
ncbi:hypothetical protein FBU59_002116 [Linderina macrospora]|uniref:Uncharacterized protein n=1 Tax=Linderina macrospora TaxID=4868 RepID=A0ACC1JCE2_9FUNG|nr:hypothetical protein FBU59_002116 [Linderina macrospora]